MDRGPGRRYGGPPAKGRKKKLNCSKNPKTKFRFLPVKTKRKTAPGDPRPSAGKTKLNSAPYGSLRLATLAENRKQKINSATHKTKQKNTPGDPEKNKKTKNRPGRGAGRRKKKRHTQERQKLGPPGPGDSERRKSAEEGARQKAYCAGCGFGPDGAGLSHRTCGRGAPFGPVPESGEPGGPRRGAGESQPFGLKKRRTGSGRRAYRPGESPGWVRALSRRPSAAAGPAGAGDSEGPALRAKERSGRKLEGGLAAGSAGFAGLGGRHGAPAGREEGLRKRP